MLVQLSALRKNVFRKVEPDIQMVPCLRISFWRSFFVVVHGIDFVDVQDCSTHVA